MVKMGGTPISQNPGQVQNGVRAAAIKRPGGVPTSGASGSPELLEVKISGAKLFDDYPIQGKTKLTSVGLGTKLIKTGASRDGKAFKVKKEGDNTELWIFASQVKPKEAPKAQPKPAVKAKPPVVEAPPVPAATEIAAPAAKPTTLETIVAEGEPGKAKLRIIVASMFSFDGLTQDEIGQLNTKIDKLVGRLTAKPKDLPTYQEVEKDTTFTRGLFSFNVHSYKGAKGSFNINDFIEAYKRNAVEIEQARAFVGMWVTKKPEELTPEQLVYASDGEITRAEAKRLGIPESLFNLIASRGVISPSSGGVADKEDIKQAQEMIRLYAFNYVVKDEVAVQRYITAANEGKGFQYEELKAGEETALAIQSDGKGTVGIAITAQTTFANIEGALDPRLQEAFKALCQREKIDRKNSVGTQVVTVCRILVSLVFISRLDEGTQLSDYGIDAKQTKLPRYDGEINKEGILKYLRKASEEGKAQENKKVVTKEDDKEKGTTETKEGDNPAEKVTTEKREVVKNTATKASKNPGPKKADSPVQKALKELVAYKETNDNNKKIASLGALKTYISVERMPTYGDYKAFQDQLPVGHNLKGLDRDAAIKMIEKQIKKMQG
jgi:hypothetical protein